MSCSQYFFATCNAPAGNFGTEIPFCFGFKIQKINQEPMEKLFSRSENWQVFYMNKGNGKKKEEKNSLSLQRNTCGSLIYTGCLLRPHSPGEYTQFSTVKSALLLLRFYILSLTRSSTVYRSGTSFLLRWSL